MQITAIPAFQDNYIWCIIPDGLPECILVDPGDASVCLEFLHKNDLELGCILITHHHHDHVGGIADLLASYPCPVYGPDNESIALLNHPLHAPCTLDLDKYQLHFSVLNVPGHTAGHMAYYDSEHQNLFCGDTLFSAGCGRLFEGSPEQMWHSLQQLNNLPDDCQVYCAHEYTLANLAFAEAVEPNNQAIQAYKASIDGCSIPSTMGLERQVNPFLRCDQASVKQAAEQKANKTLNTAVDVFAVIRAWKDVF